MLQEDPHLREQGFRVEGLDDVVDRPVGVALDDLLFFTVDGGHENNRRVTRSRTFPDQSGGREAVKIGHLHVEQDQRALVVQQEPERLPPRRGSDQALPQRFEDRSEEHTSELQSPCNLVCRLLLEKKKKKKKINDHNRDIRELYIR